MRINTNIASLNAQANNAQTNMTLQASLEKLSSGLKINKAADDASGLSIADKLRTQASSIGQGIQNANSASALIQIADKAMSEQSSILDTVKTKLIQASTSTTSAEGREAVRKDISKLLEQFDNISSQTNYNGINLLNTQNQDFKFQVGEKSTDVISATTEYAVNTSGLGSTESASIDQDAKLTFGTIDSSIALNGKTDITVSNASTATTSANLAAITINDATSSVEFGATLASLASTTTFSIEADDVKRLVLETSDGSAANPVVISTDDATMIAALDGVSNTNSSLTGSDGTYQWIDSGATLTSGGNGVIDFGAGIDISKLTFSNVSMSSDGSANSAISVVTESDVKITQLSKSSIGSLSVDSSLVGNTTNTAALSASLHGRGSSNADGLKFSDEANQHIAIASGTSTFKVDQSTANVTNAAVAIGAATSGETPGDIVNEDRDGSFQMNAKTVEKISMVGTGSVSLSTTDSATMSTLSELAKFDANLTEITIGNFQFTGTGGGTAELDFGTAGVSLQDLTFSGVKMGTEGIYVQTDDAVSVTKLGNENDQNISIQAAAGTAVGTEILQGVKTDTASVSGSLAGLKGLEKDGLTAEIANDYMATIDSAMTQLNSVRSDFGATQNQISAATRNMMVTQVNIKAAESVIRDVDYAAESANFNKQNIIAQAGTYAMSQANNIQQNVMKLLQ